MNKPKKFYNGNPNLPRANNLNNFTPEQKAELKKCMRDPVYFAEKYFKIVHVDKGLIPFKLYDYQKRAVRTMSTGRRMLMCASRQCGKDIHWNELIPLFGGGFKTMEELSVGDVIVGSNGRATTVTFKTEPMYTKNYRVTFDDGSSVNAGAGHRWTVYNRFRKHVESVMTTEEILQSNWRHQLPNGRFTYAYYIPNVLPVEYTQKDTTIDPYMLGVWLGDGTSSGPYLTCHRDDVEFYTRNGIALRPFSNNIEKRPTVFEGRIENLTATDLRHLNILDNKHIPYNYLYGDVSTRVAVLQGLIDTDGHVKKDSGQVDIQLSHRNMQLINDVYQLICSLGLKVTKKEFDSVHPSTRLSFTPDRSDFDVARMPRKIQYLKNDLKYRRYVKSRTIQQIEEIPTERSYCITVDADDHLFAVGQQYQLTHNTSVATVIILHTALFNEQKMIGLLANKAPTAREILKRIQRAYEHLPDFLKGGVKEWNKSSVEFENGSIIMADATSGDSIRGKSLYMLYIDEMAFIENWDEFAQSTLPTLSSGEDTRMIFTSTPKGLNHFYSYYVGAKKQQNGYQLIEVPWQEVPGRDEKWRITALEELNGDEQKFAQEYALEFMGSSGTLINGATLKTLEAISPLYKTEHIRKYKDPIPKHQYALVADVSRGKGLDYSAFHVIDISVSPFEQVCTYRNNLIGAPDFSSIINQTGRHYNNAYVLVELNDLGESVTDMLHMSYEYPEILSTENRGRGGKTLSAGYGKNIERGVRTTKPVKALGCAMLKMLVEQRRLVVIDHYTIEELKVFSQKGATYEAEPGNHDDTVMGLVLFSWMCEQEYFKVLTDRNVLQDLRETTDNEDEDYLLPLGIFHTGTEDQGYYFEDDPQLGSSEINGFDSLMRW